MVDRQSASNAAQFVHGRDDAVIDSKGRLLLLTDKRHFLGFNFVLCWNELGCVSALAEPVWRERVERIAGLSPADEERQYFEHIVYADVDMGMNWDAQGRIVVPQKLREKAKIEKDVAIVGCIDHVQIWGRQELDLFQLFLRRQKSLRHATAEILEKSEPAHEKPIPGPSVFLSTSVTRYW